MQVVIQKMPNGQVMAGRFIIDSELLRNRMHGRQGKHQKHQKHRTDEDEENEIGMPNFLIAPHNECHKECHKEYPQEESHKEYHNHGSIDYSAIAMQDELDETFVTGDIHDELLALAQSLHERKRMAFNDYLQQERKQEKEQEKEKEKEKEKEQMKLAEFDTTPHDKVKKKQMSRTNKLKNKRKNTRRK